MSHTQPHALPILHTTSKNNEGGASESLLGEPQAVTSHFHVAKQHEPVAMETPPPANPARRLFRVWVLAGIVSLVAAGGGVGYNIHSRSFENTDDVPVEGRVVPISSCVAGRLANIYVADNQWVNHGDLLAELDCRNFKVRVAEAEAQLAASKSASGQMERSRSQADAAHADTVGEEARQGKLNLTYKKIYAPVAGLVTRINVEQGAYVRVGQPLLALVDAEAWVIAEFKEMRLPKCSQASLWP